MGRVLWRVIGGKHRDELEAYLNRDSVPLIVLAVESGQILGAAQLKFREMTRYPEKELWLGGVYVAREHRGRGIASQLVERVVEIATSLGVSLLHRQTERLDGGLYAKLGWRPWKQVSDHGREVLSWSARSAEVILLN